MSNQDDPDSVILPRLLASQIKGGKIYLVRHLKSGGFVSMTVDYIELTRLSDADKQYLTDLIRIMEQAEAERA